MIDCLYCCLPKSRQDTKLHHRFFKGKDCAELKILDDIANTLVSAPLDHRSRSVVERSRDQRGKALCSRAIASRGK